MSYMDINGRQGRGLRCRIFDFTINGQEAWQDWFVEAYDHNPQAAEPYCCANMYAEPLELVTVYENIPEDMKLTPDEIREIQKWLTDKLYIGGCGMCE